MTQWYSDKKSCDTVLNLTASRQKIGKAWKVLKCKRFSLEASHQGSNLLIVVKELLFNCD